MEHRIFQINSLRLNKIFGCDDHSHGWHPEWFYNGSLKFEDTESGPRVFQNLGAAVSYFTEKSYDCERARGQFVTWAEASIKNWVLYVYIGSDVSDENYSNPNNWLLFGEAIGQPYTSINEAIVSGKSFKEEVVSCKGINEEISIKQEK